MLEGVSNKMKVIKQMVYGFRDSAYFFLKIKAVFPGKAGMLFSVWAASGGEGTTVADRRPPHGIYCPPGGQNRGFLALDHGTLRRTGMHGKIGA